ncbi:MAG: hypothetical protein NZ518_02290 [Dehalococcoidia bacterium]|nr:hypothetical protein [Dehalococcoidia bacterium]
MRPSPTIDYGQLFNQAFRQFGRNWLTYIVLAALALLTGAVSSSNVGVGGGIIPEPPLDDVLTNLDFGAAIPFFVAALVVIGVFALIGIALTIFVAPWARGALFAAANADSLGQPISVGSAWGDAGRRYGRLLGLHLVFGAPIALGAFALAVPVVVFIVAVANADTAGSLVGPVIGVSLLFILGVVVLALVAAVLHVWLEVSTLAAVIEDLGLLAAIRRAGAVLRGVLGAAVIMTIGFGLTGGLVSGAAAVVAVAAGGVVGVVATIAQGAGGAWIGFILGVIATIALSVLFGFALVAPFQALRMIFWTLAYRQWVGLDPTWPTPIPAGPPSAPVGGPNPVAPPASSSLVSANPLVVGGVVGGVAAGVAGAAIASQPPPEDDAPTVARALPSPPEDDAPTVAAESAVSEERSSAPTDPGATPSPAMVDDDATVVAMAIPDNRVTTAPVVEATASSSPPPAGGDPTPAAPEPVADSPERASPFGDDSPTTPLTPDAETSTALDTAPFPIDAPLADQTAPHDDLDAPGLGDPPRPR